MYTVSSRIPWHEIGGRKKEREKKKLSYRQVKDYKATTLIEMNLQHY